MKYRLLLYNIRYAAGTGWHFHLPFPFVGYLRKTEKNFEKMVRFIKKIDPDIIGLLEVDSGSYRAGRQSQVERIAEELEHYFVYKSKYHKNSMWQRLPLTSKQGNALLTNKEIRNQHFHYFKKGIKRLMIELELDDYVVFLVHLSLHHRHRFEQLQTIGQQIKKIKKPVIVAGDFNPLRGKEEMVFFLEETGLINANKKGIPSYPSRYPKHEFDFVLHSSDIRVESFEMPRVNFSDHVPLVCDFSVRH